MRVGFVGLGKLGLPCALAAEAAGHEVVGYDPSPAVQDYIAYRKIPYLEEDAQELLERSAITLLDPWDIASWADIIFVAVQTPHEPEFEGVTRLTEARADFDYSHLSKAVESVQNSECPVAVISTVLPGTIERVCFPFIGPNRLLYNPFFIAMGTTIPDFRDPEFVLVGTDGAHPGPLREFYGDIHSRQMFVTTIPTAELTKVAYNTFIGMKIVFANAMMELCEKTGADVDDLVDALSLADKRVISSAYMRGGMGDGGGCHPRDNIALSWLAREKDLSYDIFEAMMVAREKQTEWMADLAGTHAIDCDMDEDCTCRLTVFGKAYKPETNLTVGASQSLLAEILRERGVEFEHVDDRVDA